MWYLEKLNIKNLLSHEDSEFLFQKKGLTLIFGENKDDQFDGSNSNGSGKSTIIEGIVIAFTGESYRDINKDDFIRDEQKTCEVSLSLTNPILKEKLEIDWKFERRKTATVSITLNNKVQEDLVGVDACKEFIYEKIGLSKEDLLNYFIINQGEDSSFFTSTDAKQKQIISRFINYDSVNEFLKEIEKSKKELLEQNSLLEKQSISFESNIETLKELIQEKIDSKDEDEKNEKIEEFNLGIETCESENSLLLKKIEEHELKLEKTQKSILKISKEIKETEQLIKESEQVRENSLEIKKKIRLYKNEIQNLNIQKDGAVECPKCSHNFLIGEEKTIEEIESEIKVLNKKLEKEQLELQELESLLEEIQNIEEDLKLKKSENRKLENDKYEIEESIESSKRKILKNKKEIESHHNNIEELNKPTEEDDLIAGYKKRIESSKESVKELEVKIESIHKQIEEKDFWLEHLGKKGFQTYLVNKRIKLIEYTCNSFLEKMKVNIRVIINGYKVLANGDLREKIEVFISKNGSQVGKLQRYSGGQKHRIKLAGVLALHSLINNSLDEGKGLNFICLDESLDSLDEQGKRVCLGILKMFDLPTVVISHENIQDLIDEYQRYDVQYKDGKSFVLKK